MNTPIEQALAARVLDIQDEKLRHFIERELLPVVGKVREICNENASLHVDIADTAGYAWHFGKHGVLFVEFAAGATACEFTVNDEVVLKDLRPGRRYTLVCHNDSGGNTDVSFGANVGGDSGTLSDGDIKVWEFMVTDKDWTESRIEQINCRCP